MTSRTSQRRPMTARKPERGPSLRPRRSDVANSSMKMLTGAIAVLLLGACTSALSPTTAGSGASTAAQRQSCGHLAQDLCAEVIGAVQGQVPDTKASSIAIADYANPGAASPIGATSSSPDYLVAFAPWGNGDVWMNPPTWRVSGSPNAWVITPMTDVKQLSVCFVLLLRDAGLTDYAPTFPSGVCG